MRSTRGCELNEDKKDIKIEPEQPNLDDSYVLVPSESYEHPPIMDQMPTDQRIALISDAVNYLAGNTDSESQTRLQNTMKAVHDLKISKLTSSSSSSGPALLIWPT